MINYAISRTASTCAFSAARFAADAVVVVGDIDSYFRILEHLFHVFHGHDVAVVVEVAFLRQAGAAGHDGTCGAEGIKSDTVDARIVLGEFR